MATKRRNRWVRHTDLIVALDYPKAEKALELVDRLEGLPVIYKVGMELFVAEGPALVRELVHRKNRVFLDLKFHDIPNTVAQAAKQAALLRVEMFTIHLVGGEQMVQAVMHQMSDIPTLRPKVLGVSVLTSFDNNQWARVTQSLNGNPAEVTNSVLGLAAYASHWKVDGFVCSAKELSMIAVQYPELYAVVPGVRPSGAATDDQARVMTPKEAHEMGASAIVVGRPITRAARPRQVVETILKDIAL